MSIFRSLVTISTVAFSILLGGIYSLSWLFLSLFLSPPHIFHYIQKLKKPFLRLLLTCIWDCELVLSGDIEKFKQLKGKYNLLLCNHQVDSDWLYVMQLADIGDLGNDLCVMLKQTIQETPVAGYLCDSGRFMFMERKWDADGPKMMNYFEDMKKYKYSTTLMLFAEGTTIDQSTKVVSDQWSEKSHRPIFKHVLLPRVTGFTACCDGFYDADHEESYIIDVTAAYDTYTGRLPECGYEREDQGVPSILRLIAGRPVRVHYAIKIYNIKDIYPKEPMSFANRSDYFQKWLDERWSEKDRFMQEFAETQEFPTEKKNKPMFVYPCKYRPKLGDILFVACPVAIVTFLISMMSKTMLLVGGAVSIFVAAGVVYHGTHQ